MIVTPSKMRRLGEGGSKRVGIITIIAGVIIFMMVIQRWIGEYNFFNNAETVTGYIDDIDVNITTSTSNGKTTTRTDRDVFVTYTVDGKEYQHIQIDQYTDDMNTGEEITLHYNPDNPYEVKFKADNNKLLLSAFGVLIIFSLLGVIFIKTAKYTNRY